ncbi:MFS transporter [Pseudooceanicola nanhaiensis]|uniref:MFS transporter n=1 Tax=Pseudooceanicola nanhaiensis TaxID=375761 RepID=UPI001CD31517|nr:MFS transporter [Pseudooceanicola nanhaiensis]MCA0918750.1 MFS transporter [Pseudooceanicola nanhaiensis]
MAQIATALSIMTALLGSTAPSPLYPIYIARMGLDHAVSTMVFAMYAVGTLVSLVLCTWLGPRVPDLRRILLPGLVVTAAGALIFGHAETLQMLLTGRFLNGFGTGAITGMGSAALYALSAPERKHIGAAIATLAFTGGAAGGPIISSIALSLDLAPTLSPFLLIVALAVLSFAMLLLSPWPPVSRAGRGADTEETGRAQWALYLLACTGVVTAWAVGSAMMALGTDLAINVYHFQSIGMAGLVAAAFQLSAGVGQAVFGRKRSYPFMIAGFASTAVALGLLAGFAGNGSAALMMLAMPISGLAYGALFVQALMLASAAAPPQIRPALIAVFYAVGYLSNSIPIVAVGLLSDRIGLALAFQWFSLIVVCVAVAGGLWAAQVRRRSALSFA